MVVPEVVHQELGVIENWLSDVYRSIELQLALGALKILCDRYAGSATNRRILSFSEALTRSTLIHLRRFSMVFPNTELFMSLKKSFSKSDSAFAVNSVFS